MVQYNFSDEKLRKEFQERELQLLRKVEAPVDDKCYLWNKTVQKYAVTMEKVRRVLVSEGMEEYAVEGILKNINSFLKNCTNAEFHIALVGAIKAGKSTLINALLGYDYASTKVTPETASLTKFKKAEKSYVKVLFYTESEWAKVWKSACESKATVFLEEYSSLSADSEKQNWLGRETYEEYCESKEDLSKAIEKWTSSKSPVHYFVKEVEVGIADFELPKGVVLVDTPGLDDIVEYRSNITKEYINRADAVLVCVKADALTGPEMATICGVFANARYNPEKIYIVATQVDTLNRPVENWKAQREEWIKHLKGKSAYNSQELAEKNLIPVSAYLYTLLKNYQSYDEDDERLWDLDSILCKMKIKVDKLVKHPDEYKNLVDFTKIDFLKAELKRGIIDKRETIRVESIKSSYDLCKEEILNFVREKQENQEQLLIASQKGKDEIEQKYQEISNKYKESERDKKELENLIKRFKMLADQKANELEKAIKALRR